MSVNADALKRIFELEAERDRLLGQMAGLDHALIKKGAEIDELKALLHIQNDDISKLKAELELQKETCRTGFIDRDLWKSKAEKLAEALRHSHNMHHALLGKKCPRACIAKEALAEFEK